MGFMSTIKSPREGLQRKRCVGVCLFMFVPNEKKGLVKDCCHEDHDDVDDFTDVLVLVGARCN